MTHDINGLMARLGAVPDRARVVDSADTLARTVTTAMQARAWDMYELAGRMGVEVKTVIGLITGARVSRRTVVKAAMALDLDARVLLQSGHADGALKRRRIVEDRPVACESSTKATPANRKPDVQIAGSVRERGIDLPELARRVNRMWDELGMEDA